MVLKRLGIVVAFLLPASVFAQTFGPVSTQQFNYVYLVAGPTPTNLLTVGGTNSASALFTACAANSGNGMVVIQQGSNPSDAPTLGGGGIGSTYTITGGCAGVTILDQRGTAGWSFYTYTNSTTYTEISLSSSGSGFNLPAGLAASPYSITTANCTDYGANGNSLVIGSTSVNGVANCQQAWSLVGGTDLIGFKSDGTEEVDISAANGTATFGGKVTAPTMQTASTIYPGTGGNITVQPPSGTITTQTLTLPDVTGTLCTTGTCGSVNAITALTGDGSAAGPGSAAFTLAAVNTGVTSCGSATQTCVITTNNKGLVTANAAVSITFPGSGIVASAQNTVPRYSTSGTASALTGDTAFTDDGSGNVRVTKINIGGNDVGFSRDASASLFLGNGSAGDSSGTLILNTLDGVKVFGGSSTNGFTMQAYSGGVGSALYAGDVTPDLNNYTLFKAGGVTNISTDAGGSIALEIHGNTGAVLNGSGFNAIIGATTPAAGKFTSVTDSGLTSGNCVQASTGGLLATISVPCLTSSGFPIVLGSTSIAAGSTTTSIASLSVSGASQTGTDGTQGLILQAYTAGSGFGCLYPFTVTPGSSNYTVCGSSTATIIGANGSTTVGAAFGNSINFQINSGTKATVDANGLNGPLGGTTPAAAVVTTLNGITPSTICTTATGCTIGISNPITSATGGSGTGTVTCVTAACTNLRGSYTVAGGTFATGTLLALVWPTTTNAYVCSASVLNNATGASIGYHSVATATGMNITSLTAVTGLNVDIDYACQP